MPLTAVWLRQGLARQERPSSFRCGEIVKTRRYGYSLVSWLVLHVHMCAARDVSVSERVRQVETANEALSRGGDTTPLPYKIALDSLLASCARVGMHCARLDC